MRKYSLTFLFAFSILQGSAQFYGGRGDGFCQLELSDVTLNIQGTYCSGGNNDGFAGQLITDASNNTPARYCSGGDADGYTYAAYSGIQFSPAIYCSGGNADGFSNSLAGQVGLNSQSIYCSGGGADGFAWASLSGSFSSPVIFCSGGNADGFSVCAINSVGYAQPVFCYGGNADGFSFASLSGFSTGTGIWTGLVSSSWTTAGNWQNNVVPDATTYVTIPAGCPNYPALSGTLYINNAGGAYNAKRIDISDGASVTNTGSLYVYGALNISGSYVANNTTSNSQRIYSGGEIIVNPSGTARFGNQSSGTGLCDLQVNNGGILEVYGGNVDVDDQLNIMNGGTLTMTDGILFVHRYGLGSSYLSTYPGSLYVESGASGSVSGGTVKVAGKASVGPYSSVNLNSSAFSFTGNSVLIFTDGVMITSDDVDMKTTAGGILQNLTIDRPERIVSIVSSPVINGNVTVGTGSTLKVSPGANITVNGNVILEP